MKDENFDGMKLSFYNNIMYLYMHDVVDHDLPDPTVSHKRDMSDIDARLNALQEFMKRSLESAKKYSRK